MSTVVLIRPGLTDYDEQSRVLGTLEMPMNEKGMEQVEGIVRHLRREGVQLEAVLLRRLIHAAVRRGQLPKRRRVSKSKSWKS